MDPAINVQVCLVDDSISSGVTKVLLSLPLV